MLSIVVIDEDAAMRALMTEWLEAAGHAVDARAAAGRKIYDDVDVVVFNLTSVRTAGANKAQQLLANYPGAALIGVSAHVTTSLPTGSALTRAMGVCRLLAKPLARDEFLAAVSVCAGQPS